MWMYVVHIFFHACNVCTLVNGMRRHGGLTNLTTATAEGRVMILPLRAASETRRRTATDM